MSNKNFNRQISFQDSVFVDMFSRVVPHKTYFAIKKKKQSKPWFQNINALLGPSHRTVLCWLLREARMTISLYFWILKILLWGRVSRYNVFLELEQIVHQLQMIRCLILFHGQYLQIFLCFCIFGFEWLVFLTSQEILKTK